MSVKALHIFILQFFFVLLLKAQTGEITGLLVAQNGDTIAAGYVSLYKDGNQINAAYSDFNGRYSFVGLNPGKYNVSAEFLGYQTKKVTDVIVGTNQKVSLDFNLVSDSKVIDAVEIITYRKPLIDKDKQARIYTSEDIENLAVRDIAQIAATSVDVVGNDDGSGNVNIRGQRTEGTQFVVDGIKINGKISIPQNAVEQVEVISGGIPAMYGDNMGGLILITTKGGSAKPFGAIEGVSSKFLDGYNFNLITGSYAGPLLKNKKDSNGVVIAKSPLSGLISGEYRYVSDPRPSALGAWSVKDDVLQSLQNDPLRTAPTGVGTFRNAEFLTTDDLELNKANQNVAQASISFAGKIDYQASKNITVTVGGNYGYRKGHSYIYEYSLLNPDNNPEAISQNSNVFLRWKQNLNTDSVRWLSDLFYQLQVDYSRQDSSTWDDSHKDDFFKYGHIGRFKTHRNSLYEYIEDGESGDAYYYQGEEDVLYEFLGGGSNPNAAMYTSQFYNLYDGLVEGNYENFNQAQNGGALLNGDRPENVHGLWFNTGRQYNQYSIRRRDQKRILGNISAKLFGNHSVTAGFELEERIQRRYDLNPIDLWTRMRQLANSKNSDLDLENPELTFSGDVFTDTVNYNNLYQGTDGKGFYENIRDQFGIGYDEFFDSDYYGPESYSLDLFAPDELIQQGNGILQMWGYDYLGKKVNNASLNDYFHEKDESGAFTRRINPFNPIYASGYIQDKFQFDDIIFNVGLRIDRYDANQPIVKDPFVLYDAYKAGDLSSYNIPSNIDNAATVYVNSLDLDEPEIVGYRLDNKWFDSDGKEITDPSIIAEASSSGEVTPYLKNPDVKMGDDEYDPASTFEDYTPQIIIMPRISFTFNLSENSSFFAHYDVLAQRPGINQSYFDPGQYLFIENDVGGFISNSNLKPQKTIDYEVGYQQALNTKSAITLSAYYREMKDLIQVTAVNYAYPANYLTFGNSDKALVKGFSISYDLRPINSNISLTAGYSLQFADGTGSSPVSSANLISQGQPDLKVMLPLSFDQRHTMKAVVNYGFKPGKAYVGPDWNGWGRKVLGGSSANVVTKLRSGRPYTGQSNFTPEANIVNAERKALDGLINGNRLPWVYTTDLRISKKTTFGLAKEAKYQMKSEIYLIVQNLFDTKNLVRVYSATGNADDDGYLDAATSQANISSQTNYESYTDLYSIKVADPSNYALPRQIRLGFVLTF